MEQLESVSAFRTRLLINQKTLRKLHEEQKCIQIIKQEPEHLQVDIIIQEENEQIKGEEMQIEYLEEHIEIIEEQEIDCSQMNNSTLIENETEIFDETEIVLNNKRKYQRKRLKTPIKCPQCDRLFYYKSYFAFHYKDVHQEDCCCCHHCGKVFKNCRRLNSHMLIHNVGEKRFKCEKCLKEFNYSGDLLRHKKIHDGIKNYKCHFDGCGKSFIQSYALKLHLDVHNNVRYACDKCASEFSVKTTLKNHMQKCINGIATYRTPRYRGNTSVKEKESNRERYKCFVDSCDRIFSSRKYLGVHLEKHHELKLTNFETTCLECQQVFDNIGDYAKHVKIHSCLYVCTCCKLRFKTDEKLQAHIDKLHKESDDRPFICNDCGARFKRLEHLKGHQLYKHSDVKKFECTECTLKFRQRGEFNVHMRFVNELNVKFCILNNKSYRVHQNIKPFSCYKCKHLCKTSSNLRQHMRLVHDGETNIYFCSICHSTFKYNVDLTLHKKDHGASTIYEIVEINNDV